MRTGDRRQRLWSTPTWAGDSAVSSATVKWNVLPVPGVALQPDASAHQVDQRRGDREPEARAAEPAGRRAVGLAERLEDRGLFLPRDADAGVGDADVQPGAPVTARVLANRDHHVAALGELDGVADEVGEDLLQPDADRRSRRRARRARCRR